MELYKENYELKEDEYLLKIRTNSKDDVQTGFLTKLNKNGSVPKLFLEWGNYTYSSYSMTVSPIYASIHRLS